MTPPPDPSWTGLALVALPMLVCLAALAVRRLGQVRPFVVATVWMILQLSLLTAVLRWVFAVGSPWVVVAVALAMLLVSAHTVGGRVRRSAWTIRVEVFLAMALGVATVMVVLIRLTLRLVPWYAPRIVLPLLGMVLGNSVNAVALAVERLESDLRADRDLVEWRLSLGATSRQAAHPALRAAVRSALTPIINGMTIAGIVAIPGMSTSQILAGTDVGVALRYQMMIYLAISGTVGLSTLLLLAIRLRRYFTPSHQLRTDRFDAGPR